MPIVRDNGMNYCCFQQEGAAPRTAQATVNFWKQLFPKYLMSKNGDFEWPPRSRDLPSADFFQLGYLKSKVYVNKPRTNLRPTADRKPLSKKMENTTRHAGSRQSFKRSYSKNGVLKST